MSAQDKSKKGPEFTPERLRPALEYIDRYWKKLERFSPHDDGTLVGLPRPYFVPSIETGSGFAYQEMFYWDTFFIAQGLLNTQREYLMRGLVENMLNLMNRFQVIPNSARFYHTGRSQPPFLSTFIMQVYQIEKNKRWLDQAMSVAKEEYRTVWMGTAQPNWRQVFHGLSRYYDINVLDDLAEAESGWDMTTRFNRRALSYLPVDLNALLYKYEKDFEESARILGEREEAFEWSKRALERKNTIQKYLWSDKEGFYFDYNYMSGKLSPIWSLAGFFPMWAGLDDAETAARIMTNLEKFEYDGGLVATAEKPHIEMDLPAQWAYPNGWAPLMLIAIEAMERYGYHEAAERLARKWIQANLIRFEERGEFFEKYNMVNIHEKAVQGVYPSQTGFGWTNAVFERLCQLYLHENELPMIERPGSSVSPLSQLVRNPRHTLRRVGGRLNLDAMKRQT